MKRLAALVLCLACGGAATPYGRERTLAQRAYERGDFAAALAHWERAARHASDEHERSEAEYRRAATLERRGELARAEAAYLGIERAGGERAARAAFARAALVLDRDPARGHELLLSAALRFPSSGSAGHALDRVLDHVARTRGAPAALAEAERLLAALAGSELEERLRFARASRLEELDRSAAALAAYLELTERFPYPRGAYWDDALLGVARLELERNQPERAIAALERLLAERETARISGSYERKAYARARFTIAEIYRDRLDAPARARREFRRVFEDHPTSLLGDDALFEEALIALRARNEAGACESARVLAERARESRYARCLHELCATYSPDGERGCPTYALERIRGAASTPPATHFSSSSSSSSSR